MTKEHTFNIGMAIHRIAHTVDSETLSRIKPDLDEIEKEVLELTEEMNEGSKDAESKQG